MSKASCCASEYCCLSLQGEAEHQRVTAICERHQDCLSPRQLNTMQVALDIAPDALALSLCYNLFPACAQLYLSPEHDKQGAGVSTPGPNTAEQYSSLGRQRRSLHSTAATWSFSQTPVSGNAYQCSPAAADRLLGSHTHALACVQGVCLVRCSGCRLAVPPTIQGQAATVSDLYKALQQWGAMQQPLQPAPQCLQQQYLQQQP